MDGNLHPCPLSGYLCLNEHGWCGPEAIGLNKCLGLWPQGLERRDQNPETSQTGMKCQVGSASVAHSSEGFISSATALPGLLEEPRGTQEGCA